jgi:hypothetical protein
MWREGQACCHRCTPECVVNFLSANPSTLFPPTAAQTRRTPATVGPLPLAKDDVYRQARLWTTGVLLRIKVNNFQPTPFFRAREGSTDSHPSSKDVRIPRQEGRRWPRCRRRAPHPHHPDHLQVGREPREGISPSSFSRVSWTWIVCHGCAWHCTSHFGLCGARHAAWSRLVVGRFKPSGLSVVRAVIRVLLDTECSVQAAMAAEAASSPVSRLATDCQLAAAHLGGRSF